ncbi:hypothetical protein [Kitasatospora sp. LaBMicrA B282]|uniref:hypothetical protein n=1 Tax=Kitasatospora sp. LaBMicrA B282 TaxID=3420949 RepID=UPI003D0D740B
MSQHGAEPSTEDSSTAARQRIRAAYGPVLAGRRPAEPARLHAGGRTITDRPGDPRLALLPPALHPYEVPDWSRTIAPDARPEDQHALLSGRAVIRWLTGDSDDLVDAVLPHAVLPEHAVTEIVNAFAWVDAYDLGEALIDDLTRLGVWMLGMHRALAFRAEDSAEARETVRAAARAGYSVSDRDARSAATARRMGLPLIAAHLLVPRSDTT